MTRKTLLIGFMIALVLALAPKALAADSDDFVITVKTDNPGTSSDTQFTIPTTGGGYDYNVDCDDDGSDEAAGLTGSYTCNYAAAGTYTVRIKDNSGAGSGFPRIYFANGGDKDKLLTIAQWGAGQWTSMSRAFYGCTNLAGQAADAPDLSLVTDMSYIFAGASAFNQDIGEWNTANVTNMSGLFWKRPPLIRTSGSGIQPTLQKCIICSRVRLPLIRTLGSGTRPMLQKCIVCSGARPPLTKTLGSGTRPM